MKAKYLIRFDDICSTMNWTIWDSIEKILIDANVSPIVAIVPENRDKKLKVDFSRTDFWERVRLWKSLGWTIGLHGYQHLYSTSNAGLLCLNHYSEFAGLSREEQKTKFCRAFEIFEREGIKPEVWVAPAHSFDSITITVLKELQIHYISDGYSLFPYLDSQGLLWIPQQLWKFRYVPFGTWTVCYHHNLWRMVDLDKFRKDIERFRESLITFNEVVALNGSRSHGFQYIIINRLLLNMIRTKRLINRVISSSKHNRTV